ncbi:MAG: pilus assembly protein, partial [Planctomycetales bacterium]|nr:pilus assembly protein [Planctomycetales bacterium]
MRLTKECQCNAVRSRNRRGASTVEFAIVAPILVMMVWGAFEFTRFSM